jgi:hypothetical protein
MPYLTVDQAINKYRLTQDELDKLIESKSIRTDLLDDEITILRQIDVARASAEKYVHRESFKHLENVPIAMSDASLKYQIKLATIQNWRRNGIIRELGGDPEHKQRLFVNEADVAYIKAVSDITGITMGRSTLSPNGDP